jgi:hypothetical protein
MYVTLKNILDGNVDDFSLFFWQNLFLASFNQRKRENRYRCVFFT